MDTSKSEKIENLLKDMFDAQDYYGCGFYRYGPWEDAYYALREIMEMPQKDD